MVYYWEGNTLWFTIGKETRYGLLMGRNTLWFTNGKGTRFGLLMGRNTLWFTNGKEHGMVY